MFTEAIVNQAVSLFIPEIFKISKAAFSDVSGEFEQFIGESVRKYLDKQKDRYSHVKTLLKGNTPAFLYDIYYPTHLTIDNQVEIKTDKIKNLFRKSNFITIVGEAGSGKSTLVKHLFLNSILEGFKIPILIELRYLDSSNGDLEKYVLENVLENEIASSKKIMERMLKNGEFVFFLDGFDEIKAETKFNLVRSIERFVNKFENNKYILTSRPYSDVENFAMFCNCRINNLNKEKGEIDGFINLQLKLEPELAGKVINSLKDNKSDYVDEFLANPLLLTLYILTYQTNAEIPDKKYIFYRRVINALFSEHDSKTKLGYVREKRSKLSQEQFEEILKVFCFLSYFEGMFEFQTDYLNQKFKTIKTKYPHISFDNTDLIYDLKSSISLWVDDNGSISFAHRSLQEFFVALCIKELNYNSNEKAYLRIMEYSVRGASNTTREINNLLSLCKEMDTLNFYKNYELPLSIELKSTLVDNVKRPVQESLLLFFLDYIEVFVDTRKSHQGSGRLQNSNKDSIVDEGKKREIIRAHLSVKQEVYKSLLIHFDFTRELYHIVQLISRSPKFLELLRKYEDECATDKSHVFRYTLDLNNQEIFAYFTRDSRVIGIANDLVKYLDDKIKEINSIITRKHSIDEELLDLI